MANRSPNMVIPIVGIGAGGRVQRLEKRRYWPHGR